MRLTAWAKVFCYASAAMLIAHAAGAQCVMSDKEVIERVDAYAKAGDVKGLVRFADELHTFHHYGSLLALCQRALSHLQDPAMVAMATRGIAESHEGLKQWDEGIKVYQNVLDRFPDSDQVPWVRLGIARCHMGKGEYAKAMPLLQDIIQRWPESDTAAWAWERLGYCYLNMGKPADAEAAVKTALNRYTLEKHPRLMGYHSVLFMRKEVALPDLHDAYIAMSKPDAAVAEFKRLRSAYPEIEAETTFWLAKSLQWQGSYQQAAAEYEQYLSRWPIQAQMYRLQAMLNAGISHHLAGSNHKARAHWEQLTKEYAFSEPADEARLWLARLETSE